MSTPAPTCRDIDRAAGVPIDLSNSEEATRNNLSLNEDTRTDLGSSPGRDESASTTAALGRLLSESKPFRLLERLGEGATGTVYRAEDLILGRELAVKVAATQFLSEGGFVAAQFLHEARTSARFCHPSSVPVHAVHRDLDLVCLSMPLYRRGSAADLLTVKGPFTPVEATRICKRVAEVVLAAHGQSITHGNLSARKVLLDVDGQVFVADFGSLPSVYSEADMGELSADDALSLLDAGLEGVTWDIACLGGLYQHLLTGRDPHADTYVNPEGDGTVLPRAEPAFLHAWLHVIEKMRTGDRTLQYHSMTEVLQALEHLEQILHFPETQHHVAGDFPELSPLVRPSGYPVDPRAIADGLPEVGMALGKYLLLEQIGQGGSGIVFRAQHQTLDIPVAVKVLPRHTGLHDSGVLAQLAREAQILARLHHPNIVRVLDFETSAPDPYLVMEYVEGSDFANLIAEQGRLPLQRALHIVTQVAEGLAEAVRIGVVHRDIKPGNILLDSDGRVKLADLGLALVLDDLASSSQVTVGQGEALAGTAAYMSPEQVLGEKRIDHRSDIYSLGATLYHALAGQYPFTGRSHREVMLKQVNEPLTPIHLLVPELSSRVSAVLATMMAKQAGNRFQTYEELLRALRELSQESVDGENCTVRVSVQTDGPPRSGAWMARPSLVAHQGRIVSMRFHPDGHRLATAGEDRTVKVWNAESGEVMLELPLRQRDPTVLAFSPDGVMLAVGHNDGTIQLWEATTGYPLDLLEAVQPGRVTALAFSPDGRRLAAGSMGRTVILWEPASGGLEDEWSGHTQAITTIAWNPSGQTLASGSADQSVVLWNTVNGQQRSVLRGHEFGISEVVFAPEGNLLVTASWDTTIRLWDSTTGEQRAALVGHTASVRSVDFDRTGMMLASASWDKTVRIWRVDERRQVCVLGQLQREMNAVGFSSLKPILAAGGDDGGLSMWTYRE